MDTCVIIVQPGTRLRRTEKNNAAGALVEYLAGIGNGNLRKVCVRKFLFDTFSKAYYVFVSGRFWLKNIFHSLLFASGLKRKR